MRISSLDGLRALSIMFVLLAHLSGTTNFVHTSVFGLYGNFGVRVFFVISGFLITTLLLKERGKTGRISLKDFYIRRVFRIFPAAYAFILIMVVVYWASLSAANIATALTYTSNYFHAGSWVTGHLWSLSVEEQFYVLWPLTLILFFQDRVPIVLSVIASGPLFRYAFWRIWGYKGLEYPFPVVMDALAMGCLLAIAQPQIERYKRILMSRWFAVVPIITIFMPLWSLYSNRFYQSVGLTFMHAGIALSVDHSIRKKYSFLNARPVMWMGVLSYSLYLWQQVFLDRQSTTLITSFPINLILAFACATASYYLVEKPCLALRARIFITPPQHPRTIEAIQS
jgi:peptidoglycan/LPS O-acetylase OafA/YrhL